MNGRMAACSTWKYKNVTPSVFQTLQALGRQQGFAISNSPSGQFAVKIAGMQVGFQYAWDKTSGSLQLTCITRPVLVGCSTIKNVADKIIIQSGGKVA